MIDGKEVSLTIHGLPVDNGNVRADVFLRKFRTLIASLKLADSHLNGKATNELIVVDLGIGSAMAKVRERAKRRTAQPIGSAPFVGEALRSIYNGESSLERFPAEMIEMLAPLTAGIDKQFSHAEVAFSDNNVIRIDDYFARQMEKAVKRVRGEAEAADKGFEGISYGTFDGVVKELDARGVLVRGKVILTAGGKELDCVFRREDIPLLRNAFEKRAKIVAVAHYDGENPLPARLDVRNVEPLEPGADLVRWRGALAGKRVPRPVGL